MSKQLKIWATCLAILAGSYLLSAQVTVPYPNFTMGTIADPAQVNANFAALSSNALNRTGGTLAGSLNLNGQVLSGNATASGGWTFSTAPIFSTALGIASGGTNATATPTNGGVGYGTGTAHAFTAAGSSGQVLQSNGAAAPTWGSPLKTATYAATLAQVLNTTSETTILTFDVPGNAWSDGDIVDIMVAVLAKNNKGSDGAAVVKLNAGAGAQVSLGSATFTDLATEYKSLRRVRLQRVGADVWVYGNPDSTTFIRGQEAVAASGVSTPTNFTSTFTVTVKVTLDAANASFYIKPQSAVVIHYKN